MRLIKLFIFAILVFNLGCKKEESPSIPVPVLVSTINGITFYPEQLIRIEWSIPEDAIGAEVQSIKMNDSISIKNAKHIMDSLKTGKKYIKNKDYYEFTWAPSLNEKLYYAFRLRTIATNGVSEWSEIYYYNVFPYSSLTTHDIKIDAEFDFVSKEINNYYSDSIRSNEPVDIAEIIRDSGIDISKLVIIRPVSGSIIENGPDRKHFSRIVVGFGDTSNADYPFIVWGDLYGFSVNSALNLNTSSSHLTQTFKKNMIGKRIKMGAVYFLDEVIDPVEMLDKSHHWEASLKIRCFLK